MDKIGKYEVLRKIGAGGFAAVYEGRDPYLKRRVAIKTCATDSEDIRQRFSAFCCSSRNVGFPFPVNLR